jgi:hypothetical protein
MKIYYLTLTPRIVHYNGFGVCNSKLKINKHVPLMMQICKESRAEASQIYRFSPTLSLTSCGQIQRAEVPRISFLEGETTFPFRYCGEQDMLLWTRYGSAKRTFDEDAARMLNPKTLLHVRKFAILINFWNKIVSDPQHHQAYAAIRKAPNLRMLALVDEQVPRSRRVYGKRLRIVNWDGPNVGTRRLIRWEKGVKKEGKEKVWRSWDDKILDKDEKKKVQWRLPDIRFARVILENGGKRKGKLRPVDEW